MEGGSVKDHNIEMISKWHIHICPLRSSLYNDFSYRYSMSL